MVPSTIFDDILSLIRFIETHADLPSSAIRITDKANRKHLPEDAQEAILQLQFLLNKYFNSDEQVSALLKYCSEQACVISCASTNKDNWGLSTYLLGLTKGKIWFG